MDKGTGQHRGLPVHTVRGLHTQNKDKGELHLYLGTQKRHC